MWELFWVRNQAIEHFICPNARTANKSAAQGDFMWAAFNTNQRTRSLDLQYFIAAKWGRNSNTCSFAAKHITCYTNDSVPSKTHVMDVIIAL